MLRYRLRELTVDKEFRGWRRVTLQEIAQTTGIALNALSKMLNQLGASVRSENLDRLCAYFDCQIGHLVEYVPDHATEAVVSSDADQVPSP